METIIISLGLSIFLIDFLILFVNKTGIALNFLNISIALLILLVILAFLARKNINSEKIKVLFKREGGDINKKKLLFFAILFLAVFIRLSFLSDRMTPHTTDLGHHMYWSNHMVEFQELPNYNMPDFIIGEHIIFGVISILSGISVISTMPIAILFIINIFSLLAVYLFTRELIRKISGKYAETAALISLLAIGIFYTSSSPQANYVSGGVIGNIIGNFLIPLIFYSFVKALTDKNKKYFSLFLLLALTLGYTHHLSSFIFLYCFAGLILIFLAVCLMKIIQKQATFKSIGEDLKQRMRAVLAWQNLFLIFLIIIWVLFIHVPSYLNPSAVDTAVGAPSKATRTGLGFNELINTAGAWRFFYGFIGFATLAIMALKTKKAIRLLALSVALAWLFVIFMMSFQPGWLKIDIPSNRIGSYITYPAAILAAIGAYYLLKINKGKAGKLIFSMLFLVIFATGFISGMAELALNRETSSDNKELFQTFIAAEYLNEIIKSEDQKVLKDHNYMQGDTWMKLFFMQGYKYPLSRSLLRRYDDPAKPRETCTRDMISIPDSEIGRKCFQEYGVKYIAMKKGYDTGSLHKSENFTPIYANDYVIIFQKK